MNTRLRIIGITTFLMAFVFTACSLSTAGDGGKELNKSHVPGISQFLEEAASNVGEEVTIKGKVSWVCESSGRSIFITDGEHYFRINAGNDITYFDKELEGSTVMVSGVLNMSEITSERLARAEENAAANPERHEERKDHCNNKLHNVHRMQEWISANDQDYYPDYTMEANRLEVAE